ncbi:MAG: hypothetical protein K6L74_10455 [Neptuniibacter sp.]
MKKNTLLNKSAFAAFVLLLAGCGYNHNSKPNNWFKHHNLPTNISPQHLTLCTNFGCTQQRTSSFSTDEWDQITNLFQPVPETAEQERNQIANAIALMESQQGPKVGTQNDLAENGFGIGVEGSQLDCVAETSNTSIYLSLLEHAELLKFHTLTGHAHRGLFTLNLPHNTATIKEKSSEKAFAIDSWYSANGQLPWVTPVENWLTGASPEK